MVVIRREDIAFTNCRANVESINTLLHLLAPMQRLTSRFFGEIVILWVPILILEYKAIYPHKISKKETGYWRMEHRTRMSKRQERRKGYLVKNRFKICSKIYVTLILYNSRRNLPHFPNNFNWVNVKFSSLI